MTYSIQQPQPNDLPSASQEQILSNFRELNRIYGIDHVPFAHSIDDATRANPTLITSPDHGLSTGMQVTVTHMVGIDPLTDERQDWSINGSTFFIVLDVDDPLNKFTITGSDTSAELFPYFPDSGAFQVVGFPYGMHKKITFAQVSPINPNLASPKTSLYTQQIKNTYKQIVYDWSDKKHPKETVNEINFDQIGLLFQNDSDLDSIKVLAGIVFNQPAGISVVDNIVGFKTPFGFTINLGKVQSTNVPTVKTLAIPYTTTHYTIVGTSHSVFGTAGNARFTAKTLTNFTVQASGTESSQIRSVQFVSIGV